MNNIGSGYWLYRTSPSGIQQRPIFSRDYHKLWCIAWNWEMRGPSRWMSNIQDAAEKSQRSLNQE